MIRRLLLTVTAAFAAVALVRGATDVTFVMKNGERISGTFSYNHTDHYQLLVNGQQRDFPSDDIALIEFGAGDPAAAEVAQLPTVNDPPELERHTIVLKSGEITRGKIWDFQGDRVIMDIHPGDRRTYNMADIARLYISAPGSRALFANGATPQVAGRFRRGQGAAGGPRTAPITVSVPATQRVVDSGIVVNQGDRVWFTVQGQIYMAPNQQVGPDGVPNSTGRKDNPLPSANSGALIGMIGNNTRFAIGANTEPIVMPATGRLSLSINDDKLSDNRDAFTVTIQR